MKKFILLAAVIGITSAVYQPVKAQVSINVNLGTPAYYGYNTYYVPARPVYVQRNVMYRNHNYYPKRNVVVYRAQPTVKRYYSNYRPVSRHYVKNVSYKHHNKAFKHSRGHGHGKGRH